jgi:hypothetical protein
MYGGWVKAKLGLRPVRISSIWDWDIAVSWLMGSPRSVIVVDRRYYEV